MQESVNIQSMLKVGTILRGIYRIDSYLSSGGFGNTYVATNIEFDERVAIKEFFMKGVTQRDDNQTTISVSVSENTNIFGEQKEKFKKEARRIRQLKNEHIVRVHDLFEENGTAYYVMDYIDGVNLEQCLRHTGRPMTESELRLILPQILDALKAVHEEGFCHLDIKPSNIMLEKGGIIQLIDFGASKQLGANGTLTTNESTAFARTPRFAPREQAEQNFNKIGPWTDIYALGATLYNLLTNRQPPLPSDIDDDESTDKHIALPFPAEVSTDMKRLVLSMMKTNRRQRPQSIKELQSLLLAQTPKAERMPKGSVQINVAGTVVGEETIVGTPPVEETIVERKVTEIPSPKPQPKPSSVANRESLSDKPSSGCGILVGCVLTLVLLLIVLLVVDKCNTNQGTGSIGTQPVTTIKEMEYKTAIGECKYTGPIDENNNPHGRGMAQFSDGRYYHGSFEHGVLTGDSVFFSYPNGDVFKGSFENGEKKDGYGKESGINSDGLTWEYEGEYKNGTWHGKGTITWSDGDKYKGDWKNGYRTGNGTYTFKEKQKGYGYKYVGGFLNGEYHGKGTWYYVGGGSEMCTYKNGKKI